MAMRTPKDTATIMLTLDTSASMTATDVAPSRLAAAEAQASQFVEKLPRGIQVGLVSFDASARLLVPPDHRPGAAHRGHPIAVRRLGNGDGGGYPGVARRDRGRAQGLHRKAGAGGDRPDERRVADDR